MARGFINAFSAWLVHFLCRMPRQGRVTLSCIGWLGACWKPRGPSCFSPHAFYPLWMELQGFVAHTVYATLGEGRRVPAIV